jgi:hypothetical protein
MSDGSSVSSRIDSVFRVRFTASTTMRIVVDIPSHAMPPHVPAMKKDTESQAKTLDQLIDGGR